MSDSLYLILIPLYPFGIILATSYSVDGVFRYEYKNRKAAYITALSIAVLTGVISDICYVMFPAIDLLDGDAFSGLEDLVSTVGTLLSFVIFMIMAQGKVWKRVLAVFLASEIIGCINHIFQALLIQFSGVRDWPDDDRKIIAGIAIEVLTMILVFLFLFLLAAIRRKNDNTPLPLPSMGIATILLLLVNSFVADDYSSPVIGNELAKPILLLLILFTMFLFFFLRVTRKERDGLKQLNKINEELVDLQTRYFETSAKADKDIRAMRHDMRNNVQVLMLLLENKEYDKMREYLEEMGDNLTSADVSAHTGDTIADAIIAEKKALAESHDLTLKCIGKIEGIEISPVDMCKMLANLLDNAIEAASVPEMKELDDSLKIVELQFKKTDNFFLISVVNPCSKAPKIEDGKIVTSKADIKNHGFGIYNIESAAAVYGGELNVSCEETPYGFLNRAEVFFPIS